MPKFEVKLTRQLDHSATFRVEAEDDESAVDAALELAQGNDRVDWELVREDFAATSVDSLDDPEDAEEEG